MKKTFMLLLLCLCSFVFAAEVYEVEFNHNRQKFIVQNQSSAVAEITLVHVSLESKNSLDLNTVRNNVKMVRF